MTDSETTFAELRDEVRQFVEERKWQSFHAPKNIAMALAVEAAELMEHFQWLTPDESRAVADDPDRRETVGEELADVICYCLAMANELKLDVAEIFERKMAKNRRKYPLQDSSGDATS